MTTTEVSAPVRPAGPVPAWRAAVGATMAVNAAVLVAQPVLAGAYLNGSLAAIEIHAIVGSAVVVVAVLQAVLALLLRIRGRGPWWPLIATVALWVLEVAQIAVGYARVLGVHVPLGVLVVGYAVGTCLVFWRTTRPAVRTG